jgi:hypothetical protein
VLKCKTFFHFKQDLDPTGALKAFDAGECLTDTTREGYLLTFIKQNGFREGYDYEVIPGEHMSKTEMDLKPHPMLTIRKMMSSAT